MPRSTLSERGPPVARDENDPLQALRDHNARQRAELEQAAAGAKDLAVWQKALYDGYRTAGFGRFDALTLVALLVTTASQNPSADDENEPDA